MKPQSLVFVGRTRLGNQYMLNLRILYPVLFLMLGFVLKLSSSAECGHPTMTHRIVGGKSTHQGKAPWMGSLYYQKRHICGVSVVSRSWVVTAAHCADAKNLALLFVMLGTVNLTGPSNTRVTIGVKNVILHPRYDGDGSSGDLAVIELKTSINFSSNIYPICLPALYQDFPNGMMCSLTGWGYTARTVKLPEPSPLQEVDLPLVNASGCNDMFRAKYPGLYTSDAIRSDMICAGFGNDSKDACLGDSGGPLACQVDDIWLLVGIVSWGIDCATPGIPGVYTKVSNFTTWIAEKCNLNYTFGTKTTAKTPTSSTAVQTKTISTTVQTGAFSTTRKTNAFSTTRKTNTSSPTVNPDTSSTTVQTKTMSTMGKTDAFSTTRKTDAFSTTRKTDPPSPTVNPETSSTTVQTKTMSTMGKTDAFSTTRKTNTSSPTVNSDTSSTTSATKTMSTMGKTDAFSTTRKTDAFSTTRKTATSSQTVNPDTSSTTSATKTSFTLKPKHATPTVTHQCTTNGANLRSSMTMSLLIISLMISSIRDMI